MKKYMFTNLPPLWPNNFLLSLILLLLVISPAFCQEDDKYPFITTVKSVSASSFLSSEKLPLMSYHPINLYDENPATAWIEGADGNGEGEYVEFKFFVPMNIKELTFINGYGKSESLFEKNGRVKRLGISVNGKFREEYYLKDSHEPFTLELNITEAETLKMTILEVYPGSKYEDVGISDISGSLTYSSIPEYDKDAVEKTYKKIEAYYKAPNFDIDLTFDFLTPNQARELLRMKYRKSDAELERVFGILYGMIENPYLPPVILRELYEKKTGVITDNFQGDYSRIEAVSSIYYLTPNAIPMTYRIEAIDLFHVYSNLIMMGDTRIAPQYLNELLQYSYDPFCCKFPSDLLGQKADLYTLKIMEKFLPEIPYENHFSHAIKTEIETAIERTKKRLGL